LISLTHSSNVQGFAAPSPALEVSGTFAVTVVWAGAVVATNANASEAAAKGSILVFM
jgi:hypothetical protein